MKQHITLTNREIAVLELAVKGYTNPEIAEKLNVSISNIKAYVSKLIEKFKAKNRTDLVYLAFKEGFIK